MILALSESACPVPVGGLPGLLRARAKKERLELYGMELQYLLVKEKYNGVPDPLEFSERVWSEKKPDRRGARQIVSDLLKRLREGG